MYCLYLIIKKKNSSLQDIGNETQNKALNITKFKADAQSLLDLVKQLRDQPPKITDFDKKFLHKHQWEGIFKDFKNTLTEKNQQSLHQM